MQFLYQLGNGYMLGIEGEYFYRINTGYPYPQLDNSQDYLLYNTYVSIVGKVSYDDFIETHKSEFIDTILKGMGSNNYVSKFVLEFDRNIKFIQLYKGDNSMVFSGNYNAKLKNIAEFRLADIKESVMSILIVPNWLSSRVNIDCSDFKNVEFRGGAHDYAEYIYGVSKLTKSFYNVVFRDKVELFNKIYNTNIIFSGNLDWENIFPKGTIRNLGAVEFHNILVKFKSSLQRCINSQFRFSINILARSKVLSFKDSYILVPVLKGTDISSYLGSCDFGKFSPFIKGYKSGYILLDTRKMWGEHQDIMMCLLKSKVPIPLKLSINEKIKICTNLDIDEKIISKKTLFSGKDAFIQQSILGYFCSNNIIEFNLFYNISKIHSSCMGFKLDGIKSFYENFEKGTYSSLADFILSNRYYYDYLVQLFNLTDIKDSWINWGDYDLEITDTEVLVKFK